MAQTGISIQITNTVLGNPPDINSNSMLVIGGATAVAPGTGGVLGLALGVPYLLRSVEDLKNLGVDPNITTGVNKDIATQVSDFFKRAPGALLWVVGIVSFTDKYPAGTLVAPGTKAGPITADDIAAWVRRTAVSGFEYRPRQIGIVDGKWLKTDEDTAGLFKASEAAATLQTAIDSLYKEGFSLVGVSPGPYIDNVLGIEGAMATLPDLSKAKTPMVGQVLVALNGKNAVRLACIGDVLGQMASTSVGTSIGDVTLPPLDGHYTFMDTDEGDNIYTPCASVPTSVLNTLGQKQYIFPRTRPPKNGLWWNDGATGAPAETALSTLEAGRTMAALVDELRLFFTNYLNNRIPVTKTGDIQSTYKQVVLDNARNTVIRPFIESGDISDARISLQAEDNDMVGTRTWKVTLEILPAPTLRWIDGYVFYVKSL